MLVNGTIVVKDSSVLDGVYPGQPIRYEVEERGRFEPLERQAYLKNLLGREQVDVLDAGLEPMQE